MNTNPDFDRIAQTWLQEGPTVIPDRALQAALDEVHATRQGRLGAAWRIFHVNSNTLRLATAALVGVLVVAAAVFYLGNFVPSGGVGGTPSITPTPSPTAAVPAPTGTFTSANYGYSVGYPAGWTVEPATSLWWPPAWKGTDDYTGFDFISFDAPLDGGIFRAASAVAPEGVVIDAWIDSFITHGDNTCNPKRATLPEITIDGQAARINDTCPGEVEAIVVVGRRAYVFTLFSDSPIKRAIFDAFAATIDLRPDDALAVPELTETFTSAYYGYSVGYPADSTVEPATVLWQPPADQGDGVSDFIKNPVSGVFRAASVVAPDGVAIDDWIDQIITGAEAGTCNDVRTALPAITIDGQAGRIRAGCPREVEATVVVGQRVYLFTLFNDASYRRAVFDEFVATIDLRPEDALATPSPTPSPS